MRLVRLVLAGVLGILTPLALPSGAAAGFVASGLDFIVTPLGSFVDLPVTGGSVHVDLQSFPVPPGPMGDPTGLFPPRPDSRPVRPTSSR